MLVYVPLALLALGIYIFLFGISCICYTNVSSNSMNAFAPLKYTPAIRRATPQALPLRFPGI